MFNYIKLFQQNKFQHYFKIKEGRCNFFSCGAPCLENFLIMWNNPFPPYDLLKRKEGWKRKKKSYFVEMIHHNLISPIKFRFDRKLGISRTIFFCTFQFVLKTLFSFRVMNRKSPFPVVISYATANPATAIRLPALHRWTHCSRIYFSYLLSLGERRPF